MGWKRMFQPKPKQGKLGGRNAPLWIEIIIWGGGGWGRRGNKNKNIKNTCVSARDGSFYMGKIEERSRPPTRCFHRALGPRAVKEKNKGMGTCANSLP